MIKAQNYYPLSWQERERVELLEEVICDTLKTSNLFAVNKVQACVTGRTIFCWLLSTYSFFGKMHYQKIAGIINRDYGTVKHMIKNHQDWYKIDSRYRTDYHNVGAAYSRALQKIEHELIAKEV